MANFLKTTFIFCLAFFLLAAGKATGSVDPVSLYFPEGRPRADESCDDLRLMIGDGQLSRLADLVAEIESKPNFGLVVYGFVDRNECVLSACRELSFRRAKVVYDWLVRSGLSPRQLKGPIGESFGFSNEKDDGARFNRRVGFDLYVLDDASP